MKVNGQKRLMRQLRDLPAAQRDHLSQMMLKSGQEAVRVMKTLVPDRSGALRDTIALAVSDGGLRVEVSAGGDDRDEIIKARTVEGGRRADAQGGAMEAQPYVQPTRAYLAKKHKARTRRAINKAAREVVGRG